MEYTIKEYGALCELHTFIINGKDAVCSDFGEQHDADSEHAEDYGCGNMLFFPAPATDKILSKYRISVDEYNIVAEELRDKLSFGCCGWCV